MQENTTSYILLPTTSFLRQLAFFMLLFCSTRTAAQTTTDTAGIMQLIKTVGASTGEKPDSAIILYKRTLLQSEHADFSNGVISSLKKITDIYYSNGNYDALLPVLQQSLDICIKSGKLNESLPHIYAIIAGVYLRESRYDEASKYYYNAIVTSEKFAPAYLGNVYNSFGSLLFATGAYDRALYYLDKAQESAASAHDYYTVGLSLINKGAIYNDKKEWDKSRINFQSALDTALKYKDTVLQYSAVVNLGHLYLTKKEFPKALSYLHEAISINEKIEAYYKNLSFIYLGETYLELKDYKLAEQYILQFLHAAQTLNIGAEKAEAYQKLALIYEKTGQYKRALVYQQSYKMISDSILNQTLNKNINQLEVKYRTAEKDKEIALQENNLKKKNIWIGGISTGALLIIILSFGMYRMYQHRQHMQSKQIRILKQEQEISMLKAMVQGEEKERTRIAQELHDGIVSQLLAVKLHFSGTLEGKKKGNLTAADFSETLQYLEEAIRDLRKTAHNLMPETVLQGGLVVALHSFCKNMSRASKVIIPFQTYGTVPRLDVDIELSIYRIIQELVQNAIKHAQANQILVQLNCQENLLGITVEDDGIGSSQDALNGNSGMGLKNITTRLKSLKGKIDWQSEKNKGTTFYLEFDITPVQELSPYVYQVNHNR